MSERTIHSIPTFFIWRRVHSLMGFWLVVFLCEHLFVNSQAALCEDGKRFVDLVNLLQAIPALKVVECVLIGLPILFHTIWGIRRVYSAKTNSWPSDGSKPYMPYARNHAFTWQRLSSWILAVGIIAHVVQMRFIDYPKKAFLDHQEKALVKITADPGLDSLAQRLHVSLYSAEQIEALKLDMPLKKNQLVAAAPDRGTAMLLTVRDTFKSPWMCILYSLFVLAAVFHACNGFWTFLLTWGLILSTAAQKTFQRLGWVGMAVLSFLGLAAIWMTFWINLRH
ncbi:MAG: sdhC [Parachlamydiales bacterium]|nr:sdhC [Parachlamydiales bacterium]